jgi:hypothetical protein
MTTRTVLTRSDGGRSPRCFFFGPAAVGVITVTAHVYHVKQIVESSAANAKMIGERQDCACGAREEDIAAVDGDGVVMRRWAPMR